MTKAEATVNETVIEVDTDALEKKLKEGLQSDIKACFETYMAEIKRDPAWKENVSHGKGVVETYLPDDKKTKLLEEFRKGENADERIIKEQWTIALPKTRTAEIAAHMRDFIYVTDAIKGKQGDIVNIPYVKDTDFEHLASAGITGMTVKTGLVSTLQTTLYECGAYYDAYYTDIEKIDSNLLDELNSVLAHAAVRAEDARLINLLCEGTTSAWGETAMGGGQSGRIYGGEAGMLTGSTFSLSWIADAIGKMIRKGKDIRPGELVLYLTPTMYVTLLKKLSATTNTAVAYAMPTVWTKGMIESYLGVRILVGGYDARTTSASGIGAGGTSYTCGFLMRPKRCLAMAPKRDILIETDKIVASRTLRIVATHTFGAAILDQTEAVKIMTGIPSTATADPGVT